jgi:hypothetical protein
MTPYPTLSPEEAGRAEAGARTRRSFLKKRTKRLLRIWPSVSAGAEAKSDKSFLLLFLEKAEFFLSALLRGATPTPSLPQAAMGVTQVRNNPVR